MTTTAPENPWGTWRRQRWVVSALALSVALVVALVLVLVDQEPGTAKPPLPPQRIRAGATLTQRPCAVGAPGPFVPTRFTIPGVITPAPVLALPRDSRGVPDVVPISVAGMHEFAWDEAPVPGVPAAIGIKPGSSRGNALFNAHTWPWPAGGALGNDMLLRLRPGKLIVLHGKGVSQCYRVTKQVQVPALGPYPDFYNRTGRPQIAIIVCSGVRAGPGDWLSRTIWFASPFTA